MNQVETIERLRQQIDQSDYTAAMGIDAADQASRKAFISLDEADAAILRQLAPFIESEADAIVDGFYANLEREQQLLALIDAAGSSVERLKRAQRAYLLELFSGDYGPAYFERRLRVGVIHHRIGLTPRWYLGSFAVYINLIAPRILRHWWWRPISAIRAVIALAKVISLDSQLAIDTYIHGLTTDLGKVSLSKDELEHRISDYHGLIERVAQGDLTMRIAVEGDDHLAHLGEGLNRMVANLAEMTGKVTESSSAILISVEEVRSAIAAQSAGAAQQAASVSETSSTLEEIRATSNQNLEKATALKEMAERARADGDAGLGAVETSVRAMRDIRARMEGIAGHIQELNERLMQVGEITDTVGELAQQSKMLALNASIEAAKAGDAGRGFAVVAEEVKDMAEQSRQATSQVQRILEDIRQAAGRASRAVDEGNEDTERGAEVAERAGAALQSLNRVIHDTTLATQQIVAAVRQEATGIEQIRGAVGDINKVTHQFVTATRQTDTATVHLTDYATELQGMVRRFKVESLHFDFELARAVHHTWVVRLEDFLHGRETLTEDEAVSHHGCELGRWLDSEGMQRYGHIAEMQRIEAPHRELHELIRGAVVKRRLGQPIDEPALLDKVHQLSADIVDLLYALEAKARAVHEGRRS